MSQEEYDQGFFNIDRILGDEMNLNELLLDETVEEHFSASFQHETESEYEVVRHKPQLKLHQRRFIVDNLLAMESGSSLPRGRQTQLAREVGVHKSTISRIYKDASIQRQNGKLIDVSSKKVGKVGRKPKEYPDTWLQSVPLHLRTTERSFAGALKISKTTVHRLKKRGKLRSHTSNNHPSVSQKHKTARIQWVLGHINPGIATTKPTFTNMENTIHIDEKWFYLNPEMRRFYLLPKEEDPYKCCQSKRYKIKAMFMGVISRPLFDEAGNMIHDGKYGIFSFVYQQRAKKKSKNRAVGTLETKAIQNISKEVIRDMLMSNVIPSIMAKWPAHMSKQIFVQWDNARPHIVPTDSEFRDKTTENGFNIQLIYQPPQSPDLNVLDLGLFRAIQSLQYQSFPNNLDDLIARVKEAYEAFDPVVNKYTWMTLQHCMVEILRVKGGNNYKIPHCGKRRLDAMGVLPTNVEVEQELIDETVNYLNERIVVADMECTEAETQAEVDVD